MKKFLSLILAALMLMSLGYSALAEGADDMEMLLQEYDDTLSVYAVAIQEHWGWEALEAYGLNYMVADCEKVGYAKRDLDGDGIPELMIASMTEGNGFFDDMVFELTTADASFVTKQVFSGGERDRYFYAGGALFAHNGSSGADDSFDTTEEFSAGEMKDLGYATDSANYVRAELTPIVADEPIANMVNPWTQTDREGFIEAGFDLHTPLGAQDVRYSLLNGDELGQMDFTLDGLEFTARIKPTAYFEDISGMYYDWENVEMCTVRGCNGEDRRAKDGENTVALCVWCDMVPGVSYSIATSAQDLDGFDIIAIAEQVFVPLQGDAYVEGDTAVFEPRGFVLGIPEGAQRVEWYATDEQGAGELLFLLGGVECTARVKESAALEDISGLELAWNESEPCTVEYCEGQLRRATADGVTTASCIWCDMVPGISYSLNMSGSDLSGIDVIAVAEQIFVPMQGDA